MVPVAGAALHVPAGSGPGPAGHGVICRRQRLAVDEYVIHHGFVVDRGGVVGGRRSRAVMAGVAEARDDGGVVDRHRGVRCRRPGV